MLIPHPKAASPDEKLEVALFAHIDRGDDFVDHHSFFMSRNPVAHVHHASFEVHDFDTQLLGHQCVHLFALIGVKWTNSCLGGLLRRTTNQCGVLVDTS